MGMASHLGPWLLGTQKNTTGAVNATNVAAGQVRNMGVTTVSQSLAFTYTTATFGAATTAFVLPAGALITSANILLDTAFTGGTVSAATLKLSIGSTDITTSPGASIFSTLGNIALSCAATQAAAFLWRNVSTTNTTTGATGTSDALVTYTITLTGTGLTAGSGVLVIEYAVRNADGTTNPTWQQA